ncbi:hypothetical protein WT08_19745 [Burkholderia sp. MSMB1552]|uniref:Uncharacterized protein n=3 Tax=Burkholderia TaxID=32008 RepID=A0A7U4P8D0_9BURK|nr:MULTISPECIES: hypothetical protein [Burkholderia]ATF34194.1 hypothetical protein CO709_11590 [Burkholderia thailandensis]KVN06824.1 hypothetical protein WT08_19745 [Burkholderia sp. MSMB1552]KWZ51472.1 hypothetical protein WS92_21640 [Burkholderia sp. MSMB1588]AJY38955.1 hypothetical protein BW21_4156 [Burkholderia sp. 2002721687]ALX44853.1 hypothetical protein AQ610_20140 [Burkholderia humptydooensis]
MNRLRQELLDHFEKRFEKTLKRARETCSYVDVMPSIAEEPKGTLIATVTLVTVGKDQPDDAEPSRSSALYEYVQRSRSGGYEGWRCYRDWLD